MEGTHWSELDTTQLSEAEIRRIALHPHTEKRSKLLDGMADEAQRASLSPSRRRTFPLVARAALADPAGNIRWHGLEVLTHVGNYSDWPLIRPHCEHEDLTVRLCALEAAGAMRAPAHSQIREAIAHDPSPIVRGFAAVALYDMMGDDARPELEAGFETEETIRGRIGFAEALACLGSIHHEEWLKQLPADQEAHIADLEAGKNALRIVKEVRKDQSGAD